MSRKIIGLGLFGKKGFTLIELMVVISLISIIATFSISNYTQVQKQGRDAKRKTDLNQVKLALEFYYSVNNAYPAQANIVWGSAWAEGTPSTSYMKQVPADPQPISASRPQYCYSPSGTPPSSYTLYASLENSNDKDLIKDITGAPTTETAIGCT